MPPIARILVAVVLLAIAAFSFFGFRATFEPPGFVGLRIFYAALGVLALGGIVWAVLAKQRRV